MGVRILLVCEGQGIDPIYVDIVDEDAGEQEKDVKTWR